ncbi:deoxyribonuclease-1 [Fibrobacter sp. UWS1]|nr:deoxyribonuclease-1 [Fibrobacter sp. UWS1]
MAMKKKFYMPIILAWILGILSVACARMPESPQHYNFANAKKQMDRIYYGDLRVTVYCGCTYKNNKKPNEIDFESCGFQPRKNENRASRIEWEHVVTAHNIGMSRQCWHKDGKRSARKNCEETDPEFALMEGDLHNLLPSIGEVNGDRSNFMFSQWTNSPEPMYGRCESIVDFKNRKFQPRKEVRGMLARISFYMEKTYGITISKERRRLFESWDKLYPVSAWECERDFRIYKVQGDHNPFVFEKCREAGII